MDQTSLLLPLHDESPDGDATRRQLDLQRESEPRMAWLIATKEFPIYSFDRLIAR
jgi:hypothetical protein